MERAGIHTLAAALPQAQSMNKELSLQGSQWCLLKIYQPCKKIRQGLQTNPRLEKESREK